MTPDSKRDDVPSYLLGELDAPAHATFEAELLRSSQLQRDVRQCAEVLAVIASRCSAPQEEPLARLWPGIEKRIHNDNAPVSVVRTPSVAQVREASSWRRWIWPAAAGVLLVLNLIQLALWNPERPRMEERTQSGTQGFGKSIAQAAQGGRVQKTNIAGAEGNDASAKRGEGDRDAGEARETAASARERLLAEEYRKLAAEYDGLVDAIAPLVHAGILRMRDGGVWTTELAPGLNASVGEALGLWNRVRDLVPESGVAMLPDRWRLPGGVSLDPSLWYNGGAGPGATGGTASSDQTNPFALAVINQEEGLGYLDLYNLPLVPEGQELHIWLQGEEGTSYTSVGAVPQILSGASAGLVFRVPRTAGDARRVVITFEPRGGSAQPTGTVVIEGP